VCIHLLAGRHCQHVETSSSGDAATDCDSTLEDYLNTLTVSCEGDESEAVTLTWTPDDNTPDLVYYQVKPVKVLCMQNMLSICYTCLSHSA